MTEVPREFPLPEDAFERQRALLSAHVARERQSTRPTRRRVVAFAAIVLIGGVIVAPGFGLGSRVVDLFQGTSSQPDVLGTVWSPDGRKIVFIFGGKGSFAGGIQSLNADGSGLRTLTRKTALDNNPVWSPDGLRIAFPRREADFNADIHVMNADGSRHRNLTPGAGDDGPPVWSPDGQRIAFVRNVAGKGDVYVMNVDGSGQRKLARGGGSHLVGGRPDDRVRLRHRPLRHGCRRHPAAVAHAERSLTTSIRCGRRTPVGSPSFGRSAAKATCSS